ncbi:unnamed protein product [Arabidopsis halleri]
MMMSNLPQDLVEEILSRVLVTSMRTVRSICKNWNALSKDPIFTNKYIRNVAASGEREFVMIKEYSVYLVGVNLHGIQNNNVGLSIKRKGRLISMDNTVRRFCISQVFHCNGLLLCVSGKNMDDNRLVVWNPYCCKPKWIKPTIYTYATEAERFALGYDKSCGSHKILRLFGDSLNKIEIYDLSSNSWRIPNVTLDRDIVYMQQGVSLKEKTYWYARDKESEDKYLFSFDFTRERFGPRLPLPFMYFDDVSLSVVKEEQLAVLVKRWDTCEMEIWVTDKIEPEVSWSRFLKVDIKPRFDFANFAVIDVEKKVALVFDKNEAEKLQSSFSIAYIIGEKGYFKEVDLGESPYTPLSCLACSYVPSYVQLK